MISLQDLFRFLEPIKKKIFLLIGRAILTAINTDEKTMKIQVKGLNTEVITDIEWIKNYGFDSYPVVSDTTEAVIAFVNGNRDQGIALAVGDREVLPTGLSAGDVQIYDTHGNTIKLTSDGILITCTNGNIIEMDSTQVKINDTNFTVDL